MKLRLRSDTMRLRLTRGEVDRIGEGGEVLECTHFPDGSDLSYRLIGGERNFASLIQSGSGQEILIEVETDAAMHWATSQEVGYGGDAALLVGPLSILIEKDFSCITPRSGDEELDTFPNPNG